MQIVETLAALGDVFMSGMKTQSARVLAPLCVAASRNHFHGWALRRRARTAGAGIPAGILRGGLLRAGGY